MQRSCSTYIYVYGSRRSVLQCLNLASSIRYDINSLFTTESSCVVYDSLIDELFVLIGRLHYPDHSNHPLLEAVILNSNAIMVECWPLASFFIFIFYIHRWPTCLKCSCTLASLQKLMSFVSCFFSLIDRKFYCVHHLPSSMPFASCMFPLLMQTEWTDIKINILLLEKSMLIYR